MAGSVGIFIFGGRACAKGVLCVNDHWCGMIFIADIRQNMACDDKYKSRYDYLYGSYCGDEFKSNAHKNLDTGYQIYTERKK